jgi:hypothetical protein
MADPKEEPKSEMTETDDVKSGIIEPVDNVAGKVIALFTFDVPTYTVAVKSNGTPYASAAYAAKSVRQEIKKITPNFTDVGRTHLILETYDGAELFTLEHGMRSLCGNPR